MRSYIKLMSIISEIIWQEKITIELQQFSKRILEFEINTFQIFILWADSKYKDNSRSKLLHIPNKV